MTVILMNTLLFVSSLLQTTYCDFAPKFNRVHKVHNIVLYPDRSSWCNATRIIQIINHPGCNTVKIDNNVCVGTCFSYVVPHSIPSAPGYVTPYCDSCQPVDTTWKEVTLVCNDGEFKGTNITKYMEVIDNCSCLTCSEKPQQNTYTVVNEVDHEAADGGENNLIEDSQNVLSDVYASILSGNSTNTTFNIVSRNAKSEQDDLFENFLKKLEQSNDKTDFGKLMQTKKEIEDLHIKPDIRHIQQSLSNTEHPCKDIEIRGPHHSSVLSKDCYETYSSINVSPKLPSDGTEQLTAIPMLDIAQRHLKPAINGLEMSYHNNAESADSQKSTNQSYLHQSNLSISTDDKNNNNSKNHSNYDIIVDNININLQNSNNSNDSSINNNDGKL